MKSFFAADFKLVYFHFARTWRGSNLPSGLIIDNEVPG